MRRALLLIVLLSVAAGCGAQRGNDLAGVENAMAQAGTSRIEMTMKMGGKTFYTADGSFDYEHARGQIVVHPTAEADDDWDLPGQEFEGRFIGRTSYFGLVLAGKRRWVKQEEYDPTGTDLFIPGPGGPSPDRVLSLLLKSSTQVEVLGQDEIRGVSAKHYRVHVDKKKLGEGFRGERGELIVEAWIDEAGLVRRLRAPENADDGSTTTVDLFDFGVKVDVEAPPADEVINDEEFTKLLEQECKMAPGEKTKAGDGGLCMIVGEGSGEGSAPVETMPRTVTVK